MLAWEAQILPRSSLWRATELCYFSAAVPECIGLFSLAFFAFLFSSSSSIFYSFFYTSSSLPSPTVKGTLAWEQHGKGKGNSINSRFYFISMEEQSIV